MGLSPAVDSVLAHRACLRVAQSAPQPRRTASNLGLPQFGFGHDGVCWLGESWRTLDGVDLQGREWTPWTSHIRLSMLFALGMVWGNNQQRMWRLIYLGLWLAFTSVTGSFTSALLLPLALGWWLWHATHGAVRRRVATAFLAGVLGLIVGLAQWLQTVPLPSPADELPTHTSWGNPYTHLPESTLSEGGHRVHLFWCEQEWETAWNRGQHHFLLTKGTTKDSPTETGCRVT